MSFRFPEWFWRHWFLREGNEMANEKKSEIQKTSSFKHRLEVRVGTRVLVAEHVRALGGDTVFNIHANESGGRANQSIYGLHGEEFLTLIELLKEAYKTEESAR